MASSSSCLLSSSSEIDEVGKLSRSALFSQSSNPQKAVSTNSTSFEKIELADGRLSRLFPGKYFGTLLRTKIASALPLQLTTGRAIRNIIRSFCPSSFFIDNLTPPFFLKLLKNSPAILPEYSLKASRRSKQEKKRWGSRDMLRRITSSID